MLSRLLVSTLDGGIMLGRVAVLLAFPMAGLFAQAPVEVRIAAPTNAQYVVRMPAESAHANKPVVASGEMKLVARGPITIAAVDSTSRLSVEAGENGRMTVAADAPFVVVSRDTSGHVTIEARSMVPAGSRQFQYSRRQPPKR